MDKKLIKSQEILRYIYDSAEGRMEFNPDVAEEYRGVVKKCPHFENEKEAFEAASKMKKEKPDGVFMVWATIVKDEEFYRVGAPWIVTKNGGQQKAAEYIGMLSSYDCHLIL